MSRKFDFSGWATRNDIKCADGLTIRQDAFADCDGKQVPLVYMHNHQDPENVLGHALLENRDDGVYCYGSFNDTEKGQMAKALVAHGDITSLSIFANNLSKKGQDVLHGVIREVSLVLAGANPGATIDFPVLQHADGSFGDLIEDEAIISYKQPLSMSDELSHMLDEDPEDENEDEEENDEVDEELEEEEKEDEEVSHAASDEDDPTVDEVMKTFNDDQREVLEGMMALAYQQGVEDASGKSEEEEVVEQSDIKEGETVMHKNLFEKETADEVLCHGVALDEMKATFKDFQREGSLKNAAIAHGIENIDWLFPEAKAASATPTFIKRDTGWVSGVLNGVHHTPYSRIKSIFADITGEEARARGYVKDNYKEEEVISLLRRSTTPQTIDKKQKFDRDDLIDITDFDVVAWIKAEMRLMLDEEIARAILVGDGRLASSPDKIQEDHIRPIWKEADLFSVNVKPMRQVLMTTLRLRLTSKPSSRIVSSIRAQVILSSIQLKMFLLICFLSQIQPEDSSTSQFRLLLTSSVYQRS